MEVAIVGAGVAGLATGVALLQKNISCTIYERDSSFKSAGYGMTLSSDSNGPLAKLGVLDALRKLDCRSRCHWTFDGHGDVIGYYGRGWTEKRGTFGSIRVTRSQLRRALLSRFQALGGRVEWDSTPSNFTVLVGADGLHSKVRTVGPPLKPVGVSVVVGLSDVEHPLLDGQGFYVLDRGVRMFTMPFDERRTMWQLSFVGDIDGEPLEKARDLVKNWKVPPAIDLVENTKDVWASPLYDRDAMVLDSSNRSLVTVVGDACHPMTCFKGQGANQALADALDLAACLSSTKSKDIATRLRTFERIMVQRAAPRALASREAAIFLHSDDALAPAFSGLDVTQSKALAAHLRDIGVTATSPDLEAQVRHPALRLLLSSSEG